MHGMASSPIRFCDRSGASFDTELGEKSINVVGDSTRTHTKYDCDLRVAFAVRDPLENLGLSRSKTYAGISSRVRSVFRFGEHQTRGTSRTAAKANCQALFAAPGNQLR